MTFLLISAINLGVFFVVKDISAELREAIRYTLATNSFQLGQTISRYLFFPVQVRWFFVDNPIKGETCMYDGLDCQPGRDGRAAG